MKKTPRKRPSGPSGEHLVPSRKLRVPTELWTRFQVAVAAKGSNCNTVLNELIESYCDKAER
jgi:hypothetical protein